MALEPFLKKVISRWIWLGESVTRMKYPKATERLGVLGILKKTILDFPVITGVFLVLAVHFFATNGFSMFGTSLMFFAAIYVITFFQWFVGEILWAIFVWNRRARKLESNKE